MHTREERQEGGMGGGRRRAGRKRTIRKRGGRESTGRGKWVLKETLNMCINTLKAGQRTEAPQWANFKLCSGLNVNSPSKDHETTPDPQLVFG